MHSHRNHCYKSAIAYFSQTITHSFMTSTLQYMHISHHLLTINFLLTKTKPSTQLPFPHILSNVSMQLPNTHHRSSISENKHKEYLKVHMAKEVTCTYSST